jgi:hypothetical protein
MRQPLQTRGTVLRWSLFVMMLAGLPLLGIIAVGHDPLPYSGNAAGDPLR